MRKEESKRCCSPKNFMLFGNDLRPRSRSPKAYRGCNTCKLRNYEMRKFKSSTKLTDSTNTSHCKNNNNKKQMPPQKEDTGMKKVKLTDLCDDDKKRIVDLIEELSLIAEKNRKLKESLQRLEKSKHEQQEYIMKQNDLHLKEKNHYVNEINEYKNKFEASELAYKNKLAEWEGHEKFMENEITYLTKTLQKSIKDKNDLTQQLEHLKTCLKQSMESFQRLKLDVIDLQKHDQSKKLMSSCCQTDSIPITRKPIEIEADESFDSYNAENLNGLHNLGIIQDKLEHVYNLLKRKGDSMPPNPQKLDIDLAILLKNDKVCKSDFAEEDVQNSEYKYESDLEATDNAFKFLRPFDHCSKTSLHAERILRKIGKPLNLIVNHCTLQVDNINNAGKENIEREEFLTSELLKNKLIQQNNIFMSYDDARCEEDRLLDELFYTDKCYNFGLEYNNQEEKKALLQSKMT